MEQYINKSAVVAEIQRRIDLLKSNESSILFTLASEMIIEEYKDFLSFLDTLEVKEVDLEMELDRCLDLVNGEEYEHISIYQQLSIIARHFFNLGLRTQKGEFKQHCESECPNFDEAQGTPITK